MAGEWLDWSERGAPMQLHYVDDALLVVEKPPGLLSVPGRGPALADCVITRLQERYPDALTVHRLDMVTSGLLLHARGKVHQAALSRQFEQRQVDKQYIALVEGLVADDCGEIDLPLRCDWDKRPKQMVDPLLGRRALTRWRVLGRDRSTARSMLALEPVTGRAHQLRVHLASLGHPIVGDVLYNAAPAKRVCLHASALGFAHPLTGEPLELRSAAPFAL